MSDISREIRNLYPEKRELLELLLQEEGIKVDSALILPQERVWNQELGGYQMPLSFSQQRLWFLDQFTPDSPLYNLPSAIRLVGQLDVELFESSLNEIIKRHETLRTSFHEIAGDAYQIIIPELDFNLPVVDMSSLSEKDRSSQVDQIIIEEAKTSFYLAEAPLYRLKLLKINQEEHVVMLVMHHIISDGWSMGVLIREIVQVYDSLVNNQPVSLDELSIQYADFAVWQQNWLREDELDKQLNYWKQHLGDEHPVLGLPTDHPRPALRKGRGDSYYFELPAIMSKSIRDLSNREGTTLFVTLLTAFAALLCRYTKQEDIRIGTPIAGRTRKEIEGLIGFFVNTLVINTDVSGNPTFIELLNRVREVALGAYSHQDLPFETLVQELQPDRDMSIPPLFQVMFSLQNAPTKAWKLQGLEVSNVPVHSATAKFDLSVILYEKESEGKDSTLGGIVEYDKDLFEDSTIERMMNHYLVLLDGITQDPTQFILEIPMLLDGELTQLLVDWNSNIDQCPEGRSTRTDCIHQIFESQVENTPQRVAIVYDGEKISYDTLNRKANQVARYLRELGVGPDIIVGLCVERSVDQLVGLIGILKAGGAYVPLDPAYPPDRLIYMIEDANAHVLLTQERVITRLQEYSSVGQTDFPVLPNSVCLDSDWDRCFCTRLDENLNNLTSPQNLAYVIYTSGSTGKPKGVLIEHRSVVNLLFGLSKSIYRNHKYELHPRNGQPNLRLSLNAPLSFDASVQQWIMLLTGHTIYVIPQEVRLDGDLLLEFIRENELDILDCVPSQLKLLLEDGILNQDYWRPQAILPGGEAIDPETWHTLSQASDVEFYNMYGPTECTVDSTICHINQYPSKPSIGNPNLNSVHYILDSQLQSVPVGVPGELYIGGEGVSRGYLNRPELTAERFIPNPFVYLYVKDEQNLADTFPPMDRIYRTGDLVRYLPDGNIEFLGRTDFQVKVRGYRIELGEIEAVLISHPDLYNAVVMARSDIPGIQQLVAFVVPEFAKKDERSPRVIDGEQATKLSLGLRDYLSERLPDYMVPSAFVIMEAFPLTPNAKIDRKALPIPGREHLHGRSQYVAPRTHEEQILVGIWSQVLGVSQPGVCDNFFDLGGHSLLATKVVSRSRREFNLDIPLRTIFDSPTITQFAEYIEDIRRKEAGLAFPPIERIQRDERLRLSFGQQRLWFIDQLNPDTPLYNSPDAVKVRGKLDIQALEDSLNEIIRRHEVLRSSYPTVDGKAVVLIEPDLQITIDVIDITTMPAAERDLSIQKFVINESRESFNLSEVPLFRVEVMKVEDDEWVVLFNLHHIISDGWSTGVLINELGILYSILSEGKSVEDARMLLPDLKVQYVDYAAWQREWLSGEVLENQLNYWTEKLAGLPPLLEIPTDRPRPPIQTSAGKRQVFKLSKETYQSLLRLSQEHGVTMFMTMLATFQAFLHRYTGSEDIPVGTPIANRNHPEIEGLIGFFVNTLVMRADFSLPLTFFNLLEQIKEVALGAYAHQEVPFEMLVDEIQPERDLSYSTLFQVMFVLNNVSRDRLNLKDISLERIDIDSGIAKFDLNLVMSEDQEGILAGLEYNTDLFDDTTIQNFIDYYLVFVDGVVANPNQPVSTIPILNADEFRHIIAEWNDTGTQETLDNTIHGLFEAQVEKTPGKVCIVYEDQRLTFDELNARANQLAHYLRSVGVMPGELIGVCMNRSLDLVVGLLGILKAGGAYVPIDPNYPKDRQEFMINDARVATILSINNLRVSINGLAKRIIYLDGEWEVIGQMPVGNPEHLTSSRELAYVLFTSGSTGSPKGVAIEHQSGVALIQWAKNVYSMEDMDGVLFATSISFDLSVFELFVTFSIGGKVILAENALELPELINKEEVTLINTVPSAITELLQTYSIPSSVRIVNLAGEPLRAELVDKLYEKQTIERIYDLYGPSEDTTYSTYALRKERGPEIIGRPINNTQTYLFDEKLYPVPVGIPGELYLGGAGLARGYLNRPDLTAEKFIPNPFSSDPGSRLYRTGDLIRYRQDGNLEFIGRIDHQVKVRGFRIELGEIEGFLNQHPSIGDAVAWVWEDNGIKKLVGYVVPEDGHQPLGVSEMRDYLGSRLPDYMVPTIYVTLEQLPLTPNGKVDRNALPDPEMTRDDLGTTYVAPSTPEEKLLTQVWSEILGFRSGEQIGVHDNFFELGGDSILTVQVVAKANQFGLHLTPRQLFEYPTIAGLARQARQGVVIDAEQGIVEGEVVLTPIQRWFFDQTFPNRDHYNQALMFEVARDIDIDALRKAMDAFLIHHDALRMRYELLDGNVHQRNVGYEDENIKKECYVRIDMSGVDDDDLQNEVKKNAEIIQSSINIQHGPTLKLALFDLGDQRPYRLLIVAHHLVIDGLSWRILLEDLQSSYYQISTGNEVNLPYKTTSFKKWAVRLSEYAKTEALQTELPYWLDICNKDTGKLPVDHPDGENYEQLSTGVSVTLTKEETKALIHDVPGAYHTEINDILLTALVQTISNLTGNKKVLIEMEAHGREDLFDDVDINRTVGWFTSMYPVLLGTETSWSIGEAIKSIKEQLRGLPKNGIGYGLLKYLADESVQNQIEEIPEPEISFNYLGQFDQALPESGLFKLATESRGSDRDDQGMRSVLLDITGGVLNGRLALEWTFSTGIFNPSTIEESATDFINRLKQIIQHCTSPQAEGFTPSDFPLTGLDQKELDKLLGKIKH